VTVLISQAEDGGEMSMGVRLLVDIRAAFTALGEPAATATVELLGVLNNDLEAPWLGYGPNGLTGKRLGDLLREFDITSGTIRFPVGQAKGYLRDAFTDAWNRYCPPINETVTEPGQTGTRTQSVPSVPSSFSQLNPGTDCQPGTDNPYQKINPYRA
jgi:hypothetical protein